MVSAHDEIVRYFEHCDILKPTADHMAMELVRWLEHRGYRVERVPSEAARAGGPFPASRPASDIQRPGDASNWGRM